MRLDRFIPLLAPLLALTGCTEDTTDPDPPAPSRSAIVEGQTDAEASAGATVTVHEIGGGGSLTEVSLAPATVEADGHYRVEVDPELVETGDRLLIRAEHASGGLVSVLASASFDADGVTLAPDADARSTGVAEVSVAAGDVDPALVTGFLSEETLVTVGLHASDAASVEAAAHAVESARAAFAGALSAEVVGASSADVEADLEAATATLAELEVAGATEPGVRVEALLDAFAELGAEAVASAAWSAAASIDVTARGVDGDLADALGLSADRLRGEALARAGVEVLARLSEDAGTAAAEAATELRAALDAAVTADLSGAALADFAVAIDAAIVDAFGVAATALTDAMTDVDAAAGEVEAMLDAIEGTAAPDAIAAATVAAYAHLAAEADLAVTASLLTLTTIAEADAEAALVLQAMIETTTEV